MYTMKTCSKESWAGLIQSGMLDRLSFSSVAPLNLKTMLNVGKAESESRKAESESEKNN